MTYAAYDTSIQSGRVVELYEFVQGAITTRYTSRATDYSYGGHTWAAEAIGRSEIEQNHEINQAGIQISVPRNNAFAAQLLYGLMEQVCTVTIRRGFEDDADQEFAVYWKGRVAGSTAEDAQIQINCESVYTSLRRLGLRARYQRSCRHTLYRNGCGVDKAAHAVTGAIASLVGVTLTVPIAAGYADGWFTGGMVEAPDGSLRFVMRHAGSVLLLSMAHIDLATDVAASGYGLNYGNFYGGVPAVLYPGCDLSTATCKDKFVNLANHGGFPYIPGRNPIDGSSIV